MLFGSGLVGGEGLMGVLIAVATVVAVQYFGYDSPGVLGYRVGRRLGHRGWRRGSSPCWWSFSGT